MLSILSNLFLCYLSYLFLSYSIADAMRTHKDLLLGKSINYLKNDKLNFK